MLSKMSYSNELALIKRKFESARERQCSEKWCLRLWSRFIKIRDRFECVICESTDRIQAHHIWRKTTYSKGKLVTGNGITLCIDCHQRVHKEFNGHPDMNQPFNAEGGDDLEDIAYLYGSLLKNAIKNKLPQNEFYYFPNEMLGFFVSLQGYEELYWMVQDGSISRLHMAFHIWKNMPERFYVQFFAHIHGVDVPADNRSRQCSEELIYHVNQSLK